MNEPKPVPCGCGGEAKVVRISSYKSCAYVIVVCAKCKIETAYYSCDLYPYISKERAYKYAEAEAITAWNKAMGSTEKSSTVERTAKVENIQVEWGDDEYVNDRMGDMYHYGVCGNCGETVSHNQKYCHECGVKLEWNEE